MSRATCEAGFTASWHPVAASQMICRCKVGQSQHAPAGLLCVCEARCHAALASAWTPSTARHDCFPPRPLTELFAEAHGSGTPRGCLSRRGQRQRQPPCCAAAAGAAPCWQHRRKLPLQRRWRRAWQQQSIRGHRPRSIACASSIHSSSNRKQSSTYSLSVVASCSGRTSRSSSTNGGSSWTQGSSSHHCSRWHRAEPCRIAAGDAPCTVGCGRGPASNSASRQQRL